MSRGPGRWQRLLLHELYHDPRIAPSGRRYINVTDYGSTEAELSALYRAKRALVAKGWAKGDASCQLDPCDPLPRTGYVYRPCCELCKEVSVQNGNNRPHSEHLRPEMSALSSCTVSVQSVTDSGLAEHLGGVR